VENRSRLRLWSFAAARAEMLWAWQFKCLAKRRIRSRLAGPAPDGVLHREQTNVIAQAEVRSAKVSGSAFVTEERDGSLQIQQMMLWRRGPVSVSHTW
jgi:hypothetical protein